MNIQNRQDIFNLILAHAPPSMKDDIESGLRTELTKNIKYEFEGNCNSALADVARLTSTENICDYQSILLQTLELSKKIGNLNSSIANVFYSEKGITECLVEIEDTYNEALFELLTLAHITGIQTEKGWNTTCKRKMFKNKSLKIKLEVSKNEKAVKKSDREDLNEKKERKTKI